MIDNTPKTKRQLLRAMFWQYNGALEMGTTRGPVTTWGAWTLADTVALMNPCSRRCKSWQGNGHADCQRSGR